MMLFENIQELQQTYAVALPEKIRSLEILWHQACREERYPEHVLRKLQEGAHSLSGTGGILGFSRLSRAAAHLEETLLGLHGETPTSEQQERIAALLTRVRRAGGEA